MLTQLLSNLPIPPSIAAPLQFHQPNSNSNPNIITQSVRATNAADASTNRAHLRYPLHQYKVVVIGRDDACQITLPTAKVSRQHCRIYWHQDEYIVEDLHSKNGTYVNGEPCKRQQPLEDGDEIQIGFGAKLLFDNNQLRMVGKALL